ADADVNILGHLFIGRWGDRDTFAFVVDKPDVARPIIFHSRTGTCWQPYVKNVTVMSNSSYNGYRYEDVWMDK
ncbi:MAG: hypothetical protein DI543_15595, partial [Bradyrhizobium icense]